MPKTIHAVTMPRWGIEMTEGTIARWRVSQGTLVERGAEILDVETDKIVNAVEAPVSGVLRRIVAAAGETHPVGVLLGIIADAAVTEAEIATFAAGLGTPSGETAAGAEAQDARVSPIARRVAERLGVDLAQVIGTGSHGRISKEDVEAFAARATAAPPAPAPRRLPLSGRRAVIARRLLDATQAIPHYRLAVDVDFGELLQQRRRRCGESGSTATLNDWLLRAVALSLRQHPLLNAQWDGDDILQFEHADIAIAVATDAGLLTPILRNVDAKSVDAIAAESRELAARARAGSLQRDDLTGGTFTVSNLGMLGIDRFDAIINPPQVAILAVGAVGKRCVVRDDAHAIAEMGTLTLSADHRVVDGAVGAAFLQTLREKIAHPGEWSAGGRG